jgi:hypothetical protein
MKVHVWEFFETLHEDLCMFMAVFLFVLLRMRKLSDICSENKNIHFIFSNFFLTIVPFIRKCGGIL